MQLPKPLSYKVQEEFKGFAFWNVWSLKLAILKKS